MGAAVASPWSRGVALAVAMVTTLAGAVVSVVSAAPPAAAVDSAATATTVTADALPTVQVDGVVWAQVVVGTTVYATGNFTSARPAGSPAGTNEVPRARLLAYDIRSGELVSTWSPSLNAAGLSIAASPDGRTIYVGGDFTSAAGTGGTSATRYRVAAFDATTGAMKGAIQPVANAAVRAIVATSSTVYLGGNFDKIGSTVRYRVAAINASTGELLPFVANAQQAQVEGMALTPDGSKLVLAGRFTSINGVAAIGSGWVNATTGATVPFPANQRVQNGGYSAGFTSVTVRGNTLFFTSFGYLSNNDGSVANIEGPWAADATTGELLWVADCHGDTYSSYPSADGSLYYGGHPHDCTNTGDFPEVTPRVFHYGLAMSQGVEGTAALYTGTAYGNWDGMASSALRSWFPTFTPGTFTGQNQAVWSVAGNADYVVMGGEFPSVNGTSQVGLVRFAYAASSPHAMGPQSTPSLSTTARAAGTVQLSWPATWDPDDANLTYTVLRDGTAVGTVSHTAKFWDLARMSYQDAGLSPSSTHSYAVRVSDASGNSVTSTSVSARAGASSAGAPGPYATAVLADGPANYWRMGSSRTLTAWSGGYNSLRFSSLFGSTASGLPGDPATLARSFNGGSDYAYSQTSEAATNTLSVEAWVRTTTNSGGVIVGYGTSTSSSPSGYDRFLWMLDSGQVSFGLYPNQMKLITSSASYNDGQWHHIVGTVGRGSGQTLYIDGVAVANDPTVASGQVQTGGYWHVGASSTGGWSPAPSSRFFAGSIAEVATYNAELTASQVTAHYSVGTTGLAPNVPPAAVATATRHRLTASFDASGSSDSDGTITGYAWDFGDGTSGTGATATHVYSAPGTYTATVTVTDNRGGQSTASTTVTVDLGLPTASFTTSSHRYTTQVDASGSTDPDGTITSYSWDFGDGSPLQSGVTASHTYATTGTYTVTLTVTDNDGQPVSATRSVEAVTGLPSVDFSASSTAYEVAVDASASTDADGTITSYAWDFGDGAQATGVTASHTYAAAGTYTVMLTVTDNDGLQVSTTRQVVVSLAAPVASFTSTSSRLSAAFDASASSDADGTVVSYAWDFGDGTTGTGRTASHVYATGGTRTVTLTVTDNDGLHGTTSSAVTVGLAAPIARIATASSALTVSADGSTSTDTDGTVTSYAWDFGDGATGTGASVTHTYAAAGTYSLTLTVVDNDGLSATATTSVTLSSGVTLYGADTFGRTVTSGWGTADLGGPWTVTAGAGSVSGGTGRLALPSSSSAAGARLPGASAASAVTSSSVSFDKRPNGSGGYVLVRGRITASGAEYRLKLREDATGVLTAWLTKAVSGVETVLSPTTTIATGVGAGTVIDSVLSVSGASPTQLQAKVWLDGQATPSTWTLSATDSDPALQSAGHVGLYAQNSSTTTNGPIVASFDNVRVASSQITPTAPVAYFTTTTTGRSVAVDASGSSDPDGTLAGYAWSFGDGTTATGPTASHLYSTTGDKTITLTVTDNSGLSSQTTRTVTVVNAAPTASFTSTGSGRTASFDGSASSDPDGSIASYAWSFGDGTTGTGAAATHKYAADGTYTVTLTVTDNDGAVAIDTKTYSASTSAPTAAFTVSGTGLAAHVDGSGSTDADGSVASYAWDFGDGTTASGAVADHTYASPGQKTITLVVTDNDGFTGTATHTFAARLASPVASFTSAVTGLTAVFDGSGSVGSDGTITSYAWSFGDGTTGTGQTASHVYSAAGTYTVTLTLVDGAGRTTSTSQLVPVATTVSVIGADSFARSIGSGWGTATVGGPWTVTAGVGAVNGSAGTLTLAKASAAAGARLPGASADSTTVLSSVAFDQRANGGGSYALVRGRITSSGAEYRLKLQLDSTGKLTAWLTSSVSGTETGLTSPVTVATGVPAGTKIWSQLSATGASPTQLTAYVWLDGAAPPAAPTATVSDSTAALQAPGHIGLFAALSSWTTNVPVVVSFDDLQVTNG